MGNSYHVATRDATFLRSTAMAYLLKLIPDRHTLPAEQGAGKALQEFDGSENEDEVCGTGSEWRGTNLNSRVVGEAIASNR